MRPIEFLDDGRVATRDLVARFDAAASEWAQRAVGADLPGLRSRLAALEAIDRQYGGHAALALEGADELVDSLLSDLAPLEAHDLSVAIALWAVRHGVPIRAVEPIVNALAVESNLASTKQALAAAFGLMQGVIAHVAPQLGPDLERSNPERPWRLLHLNLAITAIRTEDRAMIDFAFDALEAALPDERAGFFSEAMALALNPGISETVRGLIRERHAKWTRDR